MRSYQLYNKFRLLFFEAWDHLFFPQNWSSRLRALSNTLADDNLLELVSGLPLLSGATGGLGTVNTNLWMFII